MDKITEYEFAVYTPQYRQRWEEFLTRSRNATFLFSRDYMEYHADRFADNSLIALRKGKPAALLPATLSPDGTLSSHAGLTYGGWILPRTHLDGAMLLTLFSEWLDFCRKQGYRRILYKPLPDIYAIAPSQEDRYALWRCGFTQCAVNLSSAIDLRQPWKFNMSKRQQLRRAMNRDVQIGPSSDWDGFWHVLERCLEERHEASPVHSLAEISALASRFPDNIRLYTLSDADGLQAGVCLYDTGIVVHSQYAATTPAARDNCYLTLLYHHILTEGCRERRYFDFGTSNERGGTVLNAGLLNQKFSMGATGVVYPIFSLDL